MKTHERELILYYDPESNSGKQTYAHAKAISERVTTYSYGQTPSTLTDWRNILNALQMHPKEILNKTTDYYQLNLSGKEFDEEGWLNIISKNPSLIKAPIAMKGSKAVLCLTPTDIYKLVQ